MHNKGTQAAGPQSHSKHAAPQSINITSTIDSEHTPNPFRHKSGLIHYLHPLSIKNLCTFSQNVNGSPQISKRTERALRTFKTHVTYVKKTKKTMSCTFPTLRMLYLYAPYILSVFRALQNVFRSQGVNCLVIKPTPEKL